MIVINLKNKSMRAGKKKLVDKGKPAEDFQIDQTPVTIDLLERLYKKYKYSSLKVLIISWFFPFKY